MNWEEALSRLEKGNENFVADKLDGKLQNSGRREQLTTGQTPYAIILSCADSRVVPELAFDTGLGELFVVRVAGNVANTSSMASIEYAVANLGSKLIVVTGHESCGAVAAAIAGGDNGPNLNTLLGYIQPSIDTAGMDELAAVVKENARHSAKQLIKNSEIFSNGVLSDGVQIISAYYHLDSGKVDFDI